MLISVRKVENPVNFPAFRFCSSKGEISLVYLAHKFYKINPWEIYCISNNLFDDVMRFPTKEQAIKRIEELLM